MRVPFQAKLVIALVTWHVIVTVLHLWLNTRTLRPTSGANTFRVGFLPVT